MTLRDLEARFANVSAERTHHRDQQLGTVACGEALAAAGMGNYMVVMNAFEERYPAIGNMRGYTLVCSLEPCPMCLARLLVAGVQTVKFLAHDALAGMVGQRDQFPTAWKRLWERQEFVHADVSESLRQFALDVFLLNLEACRQKILSR